MSVFPNQNLVVAGRFDNIFIDNNFRDYHYLQPDDPTTSSNVASCPSVMNHEEDSPEDCDFSDAVLRYINQMLMEEDIEDKTFMLQESLDLQAAEKSFYDVLGKKYPPSPEPSLTYFDQNGGYPDGNTSINSCNCNISGCDGSGYLIDNHRIQNLGKDYTSQVQTLPLSSISQSSYSSSNSVITSVDGPVDSPSSTVQLPDWTNESQSIWQFRKGVEEANKFLPSGNDLFVNLEINRLLSRDPKGGATEVAVKMERNDGDDCSPNDSSSASHLLMLREREREREREKDRYIYDKLRQMPA
ncbi:hypothetical protein QYF36_003307 [Acer negundo]|nr:hypothetical protein QYF36_003307 [Acer negundo]